MKYEDYKMSYEEVMDILKQYGRTKGHVWLCKGYLHKARIIQLEYDTTRRYFMTPMYRAYEAYNKTISMQRVPQDVFEDNVKFLLENGFTLAF